MRIVCSEFGSELTFENCRGAADIYTYTGRSTCVSTHMQHVYTVAKMHRMPEVAGLFRHPMGRRQPVVTRDSRENINNIYIEYLLHMHLEYLLNMRGIYIYK